MDIQIHEAQRTPNMSNHKRAIPRHIVIKSSKIKDKERILRKASKKREVTYKGTPRRLWTYFSKNLFR